MKMKAALLLVLCVILSGCALAVEGTKEGGLVPEDRLAGVVVTTEHLDLLDLEAYLRDHPEALHGGIIDTTGYEQRLYAQEVVEEGLTEDGHPCTTVRYNFDHVEGGMALLNYRATTRLEDGTVLADFHTGDCTEGFWDVTMGNLYVEGTIYVPKGKNGSAFYLNPVFQDQEGRLYLTPGTGISSQTDLGEMWKNVKTTCTTNLDGEETTETREAKVRIKWTEVADDVTILQINEAHQVISTQTYTPETVPSDITPEENCAYVLAEIRTGERVERTILQPGSEDLTIFRKTDAPYCTGTVLQIRWPEPGR